MGTIRPGDRVQFHATTEGWGLGDWHPTERKSVERLDGELGRVTNVEIAHDTPQEVLAYVDVELDCGEVLVAIHSSHFTPVQS